MAEEPGHIHVYVDIRIHTHIQTPICKHIDPCTLMYLQMQYKYKYTFTPKHLHVHLGDTHTQTH